MWPKRERRFLDGKPIDPGAAGTTLVGAGAGIEGDLRSSGDLVVGGNVRGRVTCEGRVHVLPAGVVEGSLTAKDAKVEGTVEGPVTVSGRLEVGASARILGDLRAGRIAIAEGSLVRGNLLAEEPPHRFVESRTPVTREADPEPQREP